MHIKRHGVDKSWPITRKGTKYVVSPSSDKEQGLALLLVLRDILKVGRTRKEIKKALNEGKIMLNGKKVHEDKRAVLLYDVINLSTYGKNYRLVLGENGKYNVEEIEKGKADEKIVKISNKVLLKGGKMQINLSDGRNVITNEKLKTNDSVVYDLAKNKIKKVIPLAKGTKVLIFEGKHRGKEGQITDIDEAKKMVSISSKKDGKINSLIKGVIAVE